MKSTVLRTAGITSLVTAFAVSSFGYFVMPHLGSNTQQQTQPQMTPPPYTADQGYTVNPQDSTPGISVNATPQGATAVYRAPARVRHSKPAAGTATVSDTNASASNSAPVPTYNDNTSASTYSDTEPRLHDRGENGSGSYDRPRDTYGEPVEAKQPRSTAKSAEIVLGSAGTGAAIGAMAGGGKGAGIGAAAGGVAGFIYDRMTAHPKN
jgi:hypothetical protein